MIRLAVEERIGRTVDEEDVRECLYVCVDDLARLEDVWLSYDGLPLEQEDTADGDSSGADPEPNDNELADSRVIFPSVEDLR